MKKSIPQSANDQNILWGATAFFVALALVVMAFYHWRTENIQQSIKSHFHDQAELVAERTANAVSLNINSHFNDLDFFLLRPFFPRKLGGFCPTKKFSPSSPLFSTHIQALSPSISRMHPGIESYGRAQSSQLNRLLWETSSARYRDTPIVFWVRCATATGIKLGY